MKEPLPAFGVLETGATVIVDFEDLTLCGLYLIVVTMVALPPFTAAQWTGAEAIVRPGFDYIRDDILSVTEVEGSGNLNLAAYGNLDFLTEELWSHIPYLLEQYLRKRGGAPLGLPMQNYLTLLTELLIKHTLKWGCKTSWLAVSYVL